MIIKNLFLIGGLLYANISLATYQCQSWDAYPKGISAAQKLFSAYQAKITTADYQQALSLWQTLFQYVQVPAEQPHQIYKDGIMLYLRLARHSTTPQKEAFLEKAQQLKLRMSACVGMNEVIPLFNCNCRQAAWGPIFLSDTTDWKQNAQILKELDLLCKQKSSFYKRVKAAYALHAPFVVERGLSSYQKGISYLQQAKKYRKQGKTQNAQYYKDTAFAYFEKALAEKDTTISNKAHLAYKLAYSYYNKKQYLKARRFCEQALSNQPNWGEPYLLIGNMYISSANRCASDEEEKAWMAQVLTWVAIDAWRMAKQIDPSVVEKANALIHQYNDFIPTAKTLFLRKLKEGDEYRVGCWVNRSTIIRARRKN